MVIFANFQALSIIANLTKNAIFAHSGIGHVSQFQALAIFANFTHWPFLPISSIGYFFLFQTLGILASFNFQALAIFQIYKNSPQKYICNRMFSGSTTALDKMMKTIVQTEITNSHPEVQKFFECGIRSALNSSSTLSSISNRLPSENGTLNNRSSTSGDLNLGPTAAPLTRVD